MTRTFFPGTFSLLFSKGKGKGLPCLSTKSLAHQVHPPVDPAQIKRDSCSSHEDLPQPTRCGVPADAAPGGAGGVLAAKGCRVSVLTCNLPRPAKDFVWLVLLASWVPVSPSFCPEHLHLLEFFSGAARISKWAHAVGYRVRSYDADYHKPLPGIPSSTAANNSGAAMI